MLRIFLAIFSSILLLTYFQVSSSKTIEYKSSTTKALPRFASIKSNQANTRVGPGLHYPIACVMVSKAEPIEILAELDHWREIKDFDNQISWIHVSLLSPKRYVVVKANAPILMFNGPFANSAIIANIGPKVRCELLNFCSQNVCKVMCSGVKGWVARENLWGIYETEFKKSNKLELYLRSIF